MFYLFFKKNSADPDELASLEVSLSRSTLFFNFFMINLIQSILTMK